MKQKMKCVLSSLFILPLAMCSNLSKDETFCMGIFLFFPILSWSYFKLKNENSQGTNSHGQLGQGFESELVPIPSATQLSSDVEKAISTHCQINGGGNHSLICGNGTVWGTGLDSTEQLCSEFGKKSTSHFSKIHALSPQEITTVACGWDFSLFLSANGILLGCGSNAFNQLGNSSKVGKSW